MFFITVAHSAETIPPELINRINPEANLQEIAEPGIDTIFRWPDVDVITAQVHQCFPNLNRSRNGIDPRTGKKYSGATALFPDCDHSDVPLYVNGLGLKSEEKEMLLERYYDPFHAAIDHHIASGKFSYFLDVHAMNASNTGYHPDRYDLSLRPDICLGNNGNDEGNGLSITFPSAALRRITKSLNSRGYHCQMNQPFRGGIIIQTYGARIPCIQVEISKKLYMIGDDGELIPEKMDALSDELQPVFTDIEVIL